MANKVQVAEGDSPTTYGKDMDGSSDSSGYKIQIHDLEGGNAESPAGNFESVPVEKRLAVEFRNVSTYVLPMFAPKESVWEKYAKGVTRVWNKSSEEDMDKKLKNYNQILHGIHGSVNPGEILALMGPSGSGKTTLLSILGGRAQKSMKVRGRVMFNGESLDKSVKRKIGFVMQDDLMYESLTVYETLYFAAMLRLPKDMAMAKKLERVDNVISSLKLDRCRSTIIGGFFRKGISGGERKRASVGHELLINPSVLFLDEPTSGLDSTTAMQLLEILRELAQGGRSIITTIHQPSSRLYQQLDKLLLLSSGHTLYYGKAYEVVSYFDELSFEIPPLMNAADFILDLASAQVSSKGRNGEDSTKYLIDCTEYFLQSHPLDGYDEKTNGQEVVDMVKAIEDGTVQVKERTVTKFTSTTTFRHFDSLVGGKDKGDRWGTNYSSQVAILFKRSLKTRRFESLGVQDIAQLLIIAILSGMFWLQAGQGNTVVDARDTIGVLFFMLMFLSFRTMFVSLFTFPAEQKMMLKERGSGMYRLSAFYVARTLSDFPTDMSTPTAFVIIVYFMAGLRYSAGAFFGIYGTLLLTMFVAQSYGLLLGSWFMNPKTSQAVATVIMLAFILTAGYFVVSIPVWISWLKYISFVYYSLGLLLYVQFDAGNAELYACFADSGSQQCQAVDVDNPESSSLCQRVDDVRNSLGIVQDITSQGEAIRNGMILLAFLIVLRIAVYYVLRSKTAGI
ncbi:ABC transporter G family member 9 [Picochlorum sp. SENEW3]|nr:ABC transporter G family member 9 [Picochlorum sp. SENEW3]